LEAVQKLEAKAGSVPVLVWQIKDSDDNSVNTDDKIVNAAVDEQVR